MDITNLCYKMHLITLVQSLNTFDLLHKGLFYKNRIKTLVE